MGMEVGVKVGERVGVGDGVTESVGDRVATGLGGLVGVQCVLVRVSKKMIPPVARVLISFQFPVSSFQLLIGHYFGDGEVVVDRGR